MPMRFLTYLILSVCCFVPVRAQHADSVTARTTDTSLSPFVSKVWAAAEQDKSRNRSHYETVKMKLKQQAIWNELSETANQVKLYLATNAELKRTTQDIAYIKNCHNLVQEGIFTNKGSAQTERNLSVSSVILSQLISETETNKKKYDKYATELTTYRVHMDSLLSDPVLYAFPKDSVAVVKYIMRLRIISAAGDPSDNALNQELETAQTVQNELDGLLFTLYASYEKIERYRDQLSERSLQKEFNSLWEAPKQYRPFKEILGFSYAKEKMALQFYLQEHLFRIILVSGIALLICLGVFTLKKRIRQDERLRPLDDTLLLQHPIAASLIVVLSIFQFAFVNAPYIFNFCLWAAGIACLLLLLKGYITRFWVNFWIVLASLFLLVNLDNFILQASRAERWLMLGLALAGVLFGSFILFSRQQRTALKEKYILLFIRFLVLAEVLSLLLNATGRYNLSKTLLVAGYTGTVCAILFLWVIRLIDEGLRLGTLLYRSTGKKPFQLNFNRLGDKAPTTLYVLLVAGWCIIIGRHFYFFRKLSAPFNDFLHRQRTLGSYSFSIDGLVLFIVIVACSLVLSRIVSFFADDPLAVHSNTPHSSRRVPVGSWILLIRIGIISLGLFLAFAAVGFPLDKVTIILGALSVGIGLGLQGLVSNLVSGLIIAFEKPVKVGDLIEVDGKSGVMKSVGFRSSIVTLRNGSHLVVPNGDLLNNHLVNWSDARNARKVVIPLGVAYGSDLKKAKAVLEEIARADEHIMDTPAPAAVPRGFGNNVIQIDLVCWAANLHDAETLTGNIMLEIDAAFRQHQIEMPVPLQDIRIYTEQSTGAGEANTEDR